MNEPNMSTQLPLGGMHTGIRVVARERWNPLGVSAGPGESFEFACAGRWVDWTIECGPEGYPGTWAQRWAQAFRRKRDAPWFCVIGALDRNHHWLFAIGSGGVWTNTTGRLAPLYAFANDVPGFYWNNRGEVQLDIKRVR